MVGCLIKGGYKCNECGYKWKSNKLPIEQCPKCRIKFDNPIIMWL